MANLILKKGECSTCALKTRDVVRTPQGVEIVELHCHAHPPEVTPLKVLVPKKPGDPFPEGSLIEFVHSVRSDWPLVMPDWWCEEYSVMSKVKGVGEKGNA